MKSITHPIRKSQYKKINCLKCGKEKLINKHYYNKFKHKFKQFCSETCKIYYNDPKQEHIMNLKDTSNFNYLVGLISTDGHIGYPGCTPSTRTYYCNIKLNIIDKNLLYNIQKIFGGSIVFEGSSKNICVWRVGNKDFVEFLKSIGMTNNKTYTLNINNFFDDLSNENKTAFLRGVIDGDGSLNIYDRSARKIACNGLQCSFNICSASKKFISILNEYFRIGLLKERQKSQNKKATCSLYYYYINGSKIIDALQSIYNISEDSLLLERKYKVFKKIKEYYSIINTSNRLLPPHN